MGIRVPGEDGICIARCPMADIGDVADLVVQSLGAGAPFSAIRLGDGEGRLLLWPGGISRTKLGKHLRFWFGRDDFTDGALRGLRFRLVNAIRDADVVGYYHGASRNRYWRAPAEYIRTEILLKDDTVISDNALHRWLWGIGALDRIIQQADRIVLVTCRDVPFEDVFKKHASVIKVPEEGHTGKQATDHVDLFSEICEEIRDVVCGGCLVLVGAGILGKLYCHVSQIRGAVALDIGSLFDGFVGIKSRSYLTTDPKSYILVEEANERADLTVGA